MKKIISVILAAAMLLALGVTAFADTSSSQPEPAMKSLTVEVEKWWYDNLNSHPAVTVDIYCDDEVVGTVTLSEENNWKASLKVVNTPIYDGGEAITERDRYSVKERAVAGYEANYDGQGSLNNSTEDWVLTFGIANEPIAKVEIPVSVIVKQTGNAAPGSHTFYYSLNLNGGYGPQMLDDGIALQSETGDSRVKISYTGALKGDENGFSVTTNGKGTFKGTIVIEGPEGALWDVYGTISKRAQTAPDGWTYGEGTYDFYILGKEYEGGKYEMTYELEKMADDGSTNRVSVETAEYVNTYEANRVTTGTSTIKIPAKEENPNTGAPVYAVAAAVIALGAAAIALKIRK